MRLKISIRTGLAIAVNNPAALSGSKVYFRLNSGSITRIVSERSSNTPGAPSRKVIVPAASLYNLENMSGSVHKRTNRQKQVWKPLWAAGVFSDSEDWLQPCQLLEGLFGNVASHGLR